MCFSRRLIANVHLASCFALVLDFCSRLDNPCLLRRPSATLKQQRSPQEFSWFLSGFACGIQQQAEHGPGRGLLITPYQPLPDLVDCGVCKCEFMSPWSDLVAPPGDFPEVSRAYPDI
ncbi:hypothetical protein FALBO_14715 [Fusarium albosuccineum]|uniref:Secreted protein n=1 Tax=Fusarium albosuccineum TaxID=1237068 RepID=A0A8H4KYD2_9HYPO|nr:hypothetical protein FALBO_14715 [Fusarium albosuccineum]